MSRLLFTSSILGGYQESMDLLLYMVFPLSRLGSRDIALLRIVNNTESYEYKEQ